jgi:hypothetical protein
LIVAYTAAGWQRWRYCGARLPTSSYIERTFPRGADLDVVGGGDDHAPLGKEAFAQADRVADELDRASGSVCWTLMLPQKAMRRW